MTKTNLEEGIEAHDNGDYETALRKLKPLADNGNPEAQYYMGNMYSNSDSVLHDYQESAKWYRFAAEQEHAESQFCLGLMYSIGYGVSPDMVFVYKWYKLAQLNGHIITGKIINKVKKQMTPEQIKQAEELIQKHLIKNNQ